MATRRPASWILLLLVAALGLNGCEPYMSMTDQIPAQARTATALLPEAPRYAGMVDLETVMGQIDELGKMSLADSLRQTDSARLRTFLDATGMDPETDLKALYGALGGEDSFSAVVFADLRPEQMDHYLEQAPAKSGRSTTYQGVPVYHLSTGAEQFDEVNAPDTLSLAFVDNGTIAVSTDAGILESMIDRHQSDTGGLRGNKSYMTLVEKVGHESTAWLVGRDVLQTAFRDSVKDSSGSASGQVTMNTAGFQRLLSGWADQVLGMTDEGAPFDGSTGSKVKELQSRIREQAVSLTLTDKTLEGEVYLTMRDETSATQVVDVSKGAIAAVRLSEQKMEGLKGDLLDDVNVERNGPVVHVQFAVARDHLRQNMKSAQEGRAARQPIPSIHRGEPTVRRLAGITRLGPPLSPLDVSPRACNLCAHRPVSHTGGSTKGSG